MTTVLEQRINFQGYFVNILITKEEYYNCFVKFDKFLGQDFDCISNIPYIPNSVLQIMKQSENMFLNNIKQKTSTEQTSQPIIYDFFKNILTETLTNDLTIFQSYCTEKTINLLELKDELKKTTTNLAEKENKLNETTANLSEKENKLNETTTNLSEKENKLNETTTNLSEKENKLNETINELAELAEKENKLNETTANLSEKENKLNETINELAENENKLKKLINKISEKEKKLNKLKNKLEELNYKFILNIISIIIGLIAYKYITN
jgi:chromosome segregation ATPase